MSKVDESRKRVIGIMAAILAARKLAQTEARPHSPAYEAAIYDAIIAAERILQRIDQRWPAKTRTNQT